MSTPRMTVLARLPEFFLRWADRQGADGGELARRAGIARGVPADLDARIPADKIWNLWQVLIEEFPDPDLGLVIGTTSDIRDFGLVGYTIYYSPTLADALSHIARYGQIVNEIAEFEIRESANGTALVSKHSPRLDVLRHPADARMAWALAAVREVTGSEITPVEAGFPYPRPASSAALTRVFRCTLKFDQPESSLVFRNEDLSRPVVAGDPKLLGYLDQLADKVLESLSENATFADKVRREIWSDLSSGKTTLDRIASRLGVGSRSLQRRLSEEGTSFGDELDSFRRDMARVLLKDRTIAVYDVAFLLGYSEASSFSRAFKRWESMAPDEFRKAVD